MKNYKIIGKTASIRSLKKKLKNAAMSSTTILLLGETGTGKELLVNYIHKNSDRVNQPLLCLNCANLAESLAESILFGSKEGAFTGSNGLQKGIIEEIDGGTLFLDEINFLNIDVQAKLLRFLDSGEYRPIGDIDIKHSSVRIIVSSNIDLFNETKTGKIRQDLYFRLQAISIEIPALRTRRSDIPLLLDYYLTMFSIKNKIRKPTLSSETISILEEYFWPGNVRQLKNLCEYLVIMKFRREIKVNDLPTNFRNSNSDEKIKYFFILPNGGIIWEDIEYSLIKQAFNRCYNNRQQAAKILGINTKKYDYRLKKYRII
ncbi:MAG: sigma 54-interacting transcriptional regulator [Methylomonas sp.]